MSVPAPVHDIYKTKRYIWMDTQENLNQLNKLLALKTDPKVSEQLNGIFGKL